jgi:hypothetical protein
MLADYPAYASWLTPIVLGGPVSAALVLLALRRPSPTLAGPTQPTSTGAAAALAAGLGTLALLAAPAVWSIYTTLTPGDSRLVAAGPPPPNLGPGLVGRDETGLGRGSSIPELTAFLEANRGNATYLAATSTSGTAAPIMLASGQPVMSLGGFLGNSPILTVDELATRIQAGEVRFFLVGGIPPGQDGTDANAWVQATCAPASAPGLAQGAVHLYDCGALRGVPG